MSDTQPHQVDAQADILARTQAQLTILHTTIVSDETPDKRHLKGLSNKQKVGTICAILGQQTDDFEIGGGGEFDAWLKSSDPRKATAGFYLADLRVQFFTLVRNKVDGSSDQIDQIIATNEWWYEKFADVLYSFNTGLAPERKLLH